MVWGGADKKAKKHPGRITCGQKYGIMSNAAERKEKQMWAIEKPKLDNARKKLEIPMEAATLCKIRRSRYGETCSSSRIRKVKHACIVEADESTRKRLEGTPHKDHENHIAGKGTTTICCTNLFLCIKQ